MYKRQYNHLILLAKNNQGYKNLSKLVSLGFVDGYYYKPRIDLEILEKYSEGPVSYTHLKENERRIIFLQYEKICR